MSDTLNHNEHNHDHAHDHNHDHGHEHDHVQDHGAPLSPGKDEHYWRSLEQWSNDPEFIRLSQTEFMSSPLKEGDKEEGWARRDFLKLMGSSIALASAGCVRRPVEKIVPYVKQPEEVTLGVANRYSSVFVDGTEALGIVVATREGRPVKVEGNPRHPINAHGLSGRGHAHILSLYDPERFKGPKRNLQNKERTNRDTVATTWEDADKAVVEQLKKGGVAILSSSLAGPSTKKVFGEFASAFGAEHYVWDSVGLEATREGQKASYGDDVVPNYRLDRAQLIISIDTDFLGTWLMPTAFSKQFADGRRNPKTMNQLVTFESNYSLTGANSDIRVPIRPSQQVDVVLGLAHDLIVKRGKSKYAGDGAVTGLLKNYAGMHAKLGMTEARWNIIIDSLAKNTGEAVVLAGGLATQTARQKELQVAVNLLNSALDADGAIVDHSAPVMTGEGSAQQLVRLVEAMEKGSVKTLIIQGANPVYGSWIGDRFKAAAKSCGMIISFADRNDETARLADYVLPDHHSMEGWGDVEFVKGVVSIQQPTIRPLYDTRSAQLSLMTWAVAAGKGGAGLKAASFYEYVRANWGSDIAKRAGGKSLDAAWDEALENGAVSGFDSAKKAGGRAFKTDTLKTITGPKTVEGKELVLYASVALNDGTLSNVAWLQEMPDPITKIVWDNYASISFGTAEKEKIREGDMLEVKVGEVTLKLPAHIQPGLHDDVVAIAIGYGRTAAGKVGNNIGVNAYPLMQYQSAGLVAAGLPVTFKKLGYVYELANVQGHHVMEGRQLVVEATQKEFNKKADANIHRHHAFSMWPGHQYNGHKWAMAIDLNLCNGCSSCMIACQSENNVPVVGKRYVLQGREMHWLRIDRYFVGEPANAETVFQPLPCQQCENAPCETVCPVIATAHSDEGLNDMVYNRCVGTRYCANNCPYKVRRFNWFNYAKETEKPLNLAYNPDVTVRTRGVMEKCTFCVHRIKAGKAKARIEKRELKDGDVKVACQDSCASGAIIFGDMNDAESKIAKLWKSEPRQYTLLEEFNAAPRVRYMSKIRNNGEETRFPGTSDPHKGGHA